MIVDRLRALLRKGPPVPYVSRFGASFPIGAGKNTEGFVKAYGEIGWLFSVVSRIGFAVGETDWSLSDADGEEQVEHPALSILQRPNPFWTGQELLELTQTYLDLTGEAFLLLATARPGGPPLEIWPVSPSYMSPVRDLEQFVNGFTYSRYGQTIHFQNAEVIWFRYPSPLDLYEGMGPVEASSVDLDTERFASQWNRNFFLNSARPDATLETDQPLRDEDADRLRDEWMSIYGGVDRAHRVAILDSGVKYKQVSVTQNQMDFIAQRRLNRDMICGAYGVPLHMLGISETTNRATAESAEYVFARWVVRPRLQRLRAKLNQVLLPLFGTEGLSFEYEDPTPENRDADREDVKAGLGAGVLTIDEGRAYLGLDPLEGNKGQAFLWPVVLNPVPVNNLGSAPAKTVKPTTGVNAPGGEPVGKGLSAEQKAKLAEAFAKRMGPWEKKWAEMTNGFYQGLCRRIVARLREGKSFYEHLAAPTEHGHAAWVETNRKTLEDLFGQAFWDAQAGVLRNTSNPLMIQVLLDATQTAAGEWGLNVFDIQNPEVQRWIGWRLQYFSTLVTETEKEYIIAQLRDATAAGEGIAQMVTRIEEYYGDVYWKAERVARTEVVGASNWAELFTYKQNGVKYKAWLATMDDRTRPEHLAAHEQYNANPIPINEPFIVMGERVMQPGDGSGSNCINCRCTVLPVWELD